MDWSYIISSALSPSVLLYTFGGILLGMFIGAMPGLSATMGVAILLPLTFWVEPSCGLGMLLGIYNSAIYAGGISAILLGVPGTPASIASTFDGVKISKGGEPTLALWINTFYSVMGGLFGILLLIVASFPIARFALRFGPPEFAMVAIFGLSMMVAVSSKSVSKGVFAGFIGFASAMVGMDSISGVKRFTFNQFALIDGFQFVPIMIGLFGVGEALKQFSESPMSHTRFVKKLEKKDRAQVSDFTKEAKGAKKRQTWKEIWDTKVAFFVSCVISVIIGAIPGTGGDIAGLVSWTQCRNISKEKDLYGEGSKEALAVTCAANNASIGGAMTTMLTLGVPGDSVTAILIGALMMYNYTPGPLLFADHYNMVVVIFVILIVCNIMILFTGNLGGRLFAQFTKLPRSWISVTIIIFSLVGSYAIQSSTFDVFVCLVSGIFGFMLARGGFPTAPIVLALILGDMVESNFIRTLMIPPGRYMTFFARPISLVLIILTVISLAGPMVFKFIKKKKGKA